MKTVSAETMRTLDRRTIADTGTPAEVLMDRAGFHVARAVVRLSELRGGARPLVRCFAGKGNNGGDAFVAATYLHKWGFPVEILLAANRPLLKGDSLECFNQVLSAGISVIEIRGEAPLPDSVFSKACAWEVVIDGILGTGVSGPARGSSDAAIRRINVIGEKYPVVAIDVPSGLDSDSGTSEGEIVRADITVAMGMPKQGLLQSCALEYVGSVEVADIGIPIEFTAELESDLELVTGQEVYSAIGRRNRDSHKGTYGHVLLIGGARGYAGSIAMSAMGALASGAGLVSILVPESVAPVVSCLVPEAMVKGVAETEEGSLLMECLKERSFDLRSYDAILVGPGLTVHDQSRFLVKRLLGMSRKPVIMDADALNVCAGPALNTIRKASCPVLITPHPGEMGRLIGISTEEVQADRIACAKKAVEMTGAAVVLKGAGTIIYEEGMPLAVNMTGNPGQASGGMGDVLSGIVTAFAGRKYSVYDSARFGSYIHGRAADITAMRSSEAGVTLQGLLESIPFVFREMREL